MPIWSTYRDPEGTHRISGGNSRSDRGKAGYPFEPRQKSLNLLLYSDADDNASTLLKGSNHEYKMHGSSELTDYDSVAVYLNGVSMPEHDFEIDFDKGILKVKRSITNLDQGIEVRSKEDSNFSNVDDVLILKVTPGLLEYQDLELYTPSYGDEINLLRIVNFEENQKNDLFIKEFDNDNQKGYVLSHKIKPDGIYARIKIKIPNG